MGDRELAVQYWSRCVELAPQFMQARYALARLALAGADYSEVARQARAALAIEPSSVAFRDLLGCSLIELGEPQGAIDTLHRSVDEQVASCDTYTLLGKAYLVQRDYEQAAENYRRAVAIDPGWSKALYGLATACARNGKTEEAQRSFEQFRRRQSTAVVQSSEQQLAAARHDVALVYRDMAAIFQRYGDSPSSRDLLYKSEQLNPATRDGPARSLQHLSGRISDTGS
jgi:tetratricopeptide (TPR) repeat protein